MCDRAPDREEDLRYGSPRFFPEAPKCRRTTVGIRDAIVLFNVNLCREEVPKGGRRRFRATMRHEETLRLVAHEKNLSSKM